MFEIAPIEVNIPAGTVAAIKATPASAFHDVAPQPAPPMAPPDNLSGRAKRAWEREQRRLARQRRADARLERQFQLAIPSVLKQPKVFMTREGEKAPLENHWFGATLFVICSGPSINALPLQRLTERGIVTMAINNAAMVVRPTLWSYVDPVEKFHSSIWLDAGITKLIPARHFGERMRRQLPDGNFERTRIQVGNLPNVYGYVRGANFNPEVYLTEPEINFGNSKRNLSNGQPHIINVFFTIFKLAYYLGFRTVNLLGCDFSMSHGQSYAFEEEKHAGAVVSNNAKYGTLGKMIGQLKPKFDKAGFKVFNCNEKSGLRVFPFKSFAQAVDEATAATSDTRTRGWYTKGSK